MAKTSMKVKQQRKPKFSTQAYTRCNICGRPHSVLKKYGICRVCFRELALTKASVGAWVLSVYATWCHRVARKLPDNRKSQIIRRKSK